MNYFKSIWNEKVAEEEWGNSIWFFEIRADGYPNRQIEVYENGIRLKYDNEHSNDKFGQLGDQSMDENSNENWGDNISANEFESEWKKPTTNQH